MVRTLLRYDNEMCVTDTIAMNEVANPLDSERFPHAPSEMLSDAHDLGCNSVGNVREMIDMLIWNYETFAWGGRLQGHEGRYLIIPVHEARWRIARDNLTKRASHVRTRE
jgi:hypothetical protein